jgi:hypothetical protein
MEQSTYIEKCRKVANDMKKSIPKPIGVENPELDHIVPVIFGFTHNIDWEIISLRENFVWISRDDNRSKSQELTKDGRELLKKWFDDGLIDTPIAQETKKTTEDFSFDSIIESLNHTSMVAYNIPTSVAINVAPVWCQRDETLRWPKTKNALGRVPLDTHRMMTFFLYPDGHFERGDGNTRSFTWRNNLQFPDYEIPEEILGIFIKVRDAQHAEQLYHSIDSTLTAETFSEKLSGYIRHKGYSDRLPKKWKKGESVYDIALIVLENYLPPGETEYVTLERTSSDGERAAKTAEKLDYFIDELVTVGNLVGQKNIPRQLTAPLIGMLIRYLMNSKDNKTYKGIQFLTDYLTNQGYTPWARIKTAKTPELKNLLIMMDELQTTDEIGGVLNPYLKYDASSRRVLPDMATKTSGNVQDRRMYCGWITYCFDKYLVGEVMDEDIIFDITGAKITGETKVSIADKLKQKAQSTIMSKYDNFWKHGLQTTTK